MVVIVTDEPNNGREIEDVFSTKGLDTRILTAERFKEGLQDDIDLIVYDVYRLRNNIDIENIHIAKKRNIAVLLITAYPEEEDERKEISRLWRCGFIKDYLIRPVSREMLLRYIYNK